jgi:ricin-type beta-trefoil lectin protein
MYAPMADYRRQQLLDEAANERLAGQVTAKARTRKSHRFTSLVARLSMLVVLLVGTFAPNLGATSAYAYGAPVAGEQFVTGLDQNTIYNIRTVSVSLFVGGNDYDDAPVTISGGDDRLDQMWRFQEVKFVNGEEAYEVVNIQDNERCLSVYYDSRDAGGKIVLYDCHGWDDQLWMISKKNGHYFFRAVSSGYYLDLPYDSGYWGTQLNQQTPNCFCSGDNATGNEQFDLVVFNTPLENYWTRISTAWSLNLDTASNSNHAAVNQEPLNYGRNSQLWVISRLPNGHYIIQNYAAPNTCITLNYGSVAPGGLIVQDTCYNYLDQQWDLLPTSRVGGWGWKIRSVLTHYLLEVPGGMGWWGLQMDQWPANGGTNQLWTIGY